MPCRFNRRRIWTHRILLETLDHAENSFVTLTYSNEKVPGDFGLVPEHFRDFLKRLRKRIEPRRIRFYGVGEYGDHTNRPHYHCALFGWPSCAGGPYQGGVCQCLGCSVVRETWDFGHVHVGRLEMKSAQYLAGYVTKKMTMRDDPRLRGRHPEFARMSLRPGVGANAMWNVASEMMRWDLEKRRDVPAALSIGGREMPLGRYLRSQLRKMVGNGEKAPENALQELANQVQIVREFAFNNSRSVKSVFAELNEPYANRIRFRESLRSRTL